MKEEFTAQQELPALRLPDPKHFGGLPCPRAQQTHAILSELTASDTKSPTLIGLHVAWWRRGLVVQIMQTIRVLQPAQSPCLLYALALVAALSSSAFLIIRRFLSTNER